MLIAHVVFRFDYGGLENGVVNLISGLSDGRFRHVVIALTEVTGFASRLPDGVETHSINKKPGKDFGAYVRLFRLLRELRPDIVHTRNLGTMECAFVASLARVPVRIHGEHGWDIFDPDGTNSKYRFMRRVLHRFVHRFVTVSGDLQRWLTSAVGIPGSKICHIYNGVDTERFRPRNEARQGSTADLIIGSVTRFSAIKDPLNLVDAFIKICRDGAKPTLVMVGDGELREAALQRLRAAGIDEAARLPGSRDDIPDILHSMDVFVLGSLKEGISNTLLEAMASGLPVIATDTGGNPELVEDGVNGMLVPPGNADALASAIATYIEDPQKRRNHGQASRRIAVSRFSINTMVDNYRQLYMSELGLQAG